MSLNKTQIDSLARRNVKANSVSYSNADLTADENIGMDKAFAIIFKAAGKWQFDDSNHDDYPFIMTDINAGQRDYAFVDDENGNLILDIYKVMRKNADGIYEEIFPVDQQSDPDMSEFYDGRDIQGIPQEYDKTANGIFFKTIPNYTSEKGLKLFISREGSYFTTSDTTKKPGFAGLFHEYIALYPSYLYALRNLSQAKIDRFKAELLEMENKIAKHYRDRSKDEDLVVTAQPINSV